MMCDVGERLVVRWSFLSRMRAHPLTAATCGVLLAALTATLGAPGAILLGAVGACALLMYSWVGWSPPRLVLSDDEARMHDGGFRAETRRVHGGRLVAHAPVRATLAEARQDGVQLVREAIEAAGSTTE